MKIELSEDEREIIKDALERYSNNKEGKYYDEIISILEKVE